MHGLGMWLDQEYTTVREDVGSIWPWIVCGFAALFLGLLGGFLS